LNKGGIFYGISVIIGVAGVLAGVLLGLSETNFFVTLQTWTIAAILTLVFIFFANVLDSLDKISNQISGLKEEKSPAPTTSDVPGSSSAAPDFQEHGQANQPLTGTNEWTCPSCGKVNQNDAGSCVCGKQKP